MRTIRITRQGFPNHGQHSWMTYFKFVLSKKYNVLIDPVNPDIVIQSDLSYNEKAIDTFTGAMPTSYSTQDRNKKFIYVSGEVSDFRSVLDRGENQWSIGYGKFEHPRYLRQPSCVFDVWTMFDESRIVDAPLNWLTEKRNFDLISKRNIGFCSVTQASDNAVRGLIFDRLSTYKHVSSSGPWRQTAEPLNKYQWMAAEYIGRNDGLTYREKIEFFNNYRYNISVHYTNTPYIIQEKIFHAYFSGAIPIFFGNEHILEEGFNPGAFINMHRGSMNEALDYMMDDVLRIDGSLLEYKNIIEEPLFLSVPDYFNFDYTLSFLEGVVES